MQSQMQNQTQPPNKVLGYATITDVDGIALVVSDRRHGGKHCSIITGKAYPYIEESPTHVYLLIDTVDEFGASDGPRICPWEKRRATLSKERM